MNSDNNRTLEYGLKYVLKSDIKSELLHGIIPWQFRSNSKTVTLNCD